MSKSQLPEQTLGLDLAQCAALARLNNLELSDMLQGLYANPAESRKNFNLWLGAARAQVLRAEQIMGVPGTLWELRNGQFFWTSQSGTVWNPVPKLS